MNAPHESWKDIAVLFAMLKIIIQTLLYSPSFTANDIDRYYIRFFLVNAILALLREEGVFIEAATRGVQLKKVFLEISQNSQENTCVSVSFLIKLQAWGITGVFLWILWNF